MKYRKYNSIENTYREQAIDEWISYHPVLTKSTFILTEKIDGANIQINFNPNEKIGLGKRTSEIVEGDKFFNIFNVIKSYGAEIKRIQEYVDSNQKSLRLYGEIYGRGVLKRINYGEGKSIRFYDCMIEKDGEEVHMSQKEVIQLMKELKLGHLFVPIIKITTDLEEALSFDVSPLTSAFNPQEPAEGIVIKLYDSIVVNGDGSPFMFKKKNEKFLEKEKEKIIREKKVYKDNIVELHDAFLKYLNDNRLQGIFSKNGMITSKKEIGKFIGLVVLDARTDFLKDHEEVKELEKDAQKFIFKPSSNLPKMIMGYLK